MQPTDFAKALSHYLGVYLPGQRNVSANTVKSYRDTFKLLLRYCEQECQLSIEKLGLKRLNKSLVLGFLSWLENDRHNTVSTRNQRLACIHGFCRYLQLDVNDPVGLLSHQQILSIPIKKTPDANHPSPEAVPPTLGLCIVLTVRCFRCTADPGPARGVERLKGRRDLTLLCVLYGSPTDRL